MRERPYYSIRTGKNPTGGKFDLRMLCELLAALYKKFDDWSYFDEAFGYHMAEGKVDGTLGSDMGAYVLKQLRKSDLWPIRIYHKYYKEDDAFDIIELLYDCISRPENVSEDYGPGSFDKEAGRKEFREEVNELLRDYSQGYELSEEGEIYALPETGLETLLSAPVPAYDAENVENRIDAAVKKFRNRHSTPDERRDSVRDLADVLEFLREKVKELDVITKKDEGDLFNIANNFAVRHHNDVQKSDYDKSIWHSWMFYFYLATIHAALRLINKKEEAA
jgi:hypothetical protein